jgi:glycine cleavage system H protein
MEFREGLLYTESHEWVKDEGSHATIGITDYAQHQMKDVVYVELPEVGAEFKKGDAVGVVESVKTVADIYSPVSGKVMETNQALKDHPQYINEDPFAKGWIVKMTLQNKEELKELLSSADYEKSLPEE